MSEWQELSNESLWRKLAVGVWGSPSEPVMTTRIRVRADALIEYVEALDAAVDERVTPTAVFVRALAAFFDRHPDLNVGMVRNRVVRRSSIDIFCQVAIPGEGDGGSDLSGVKIEDCEDLDVVQIAGLLDESVGDVRRDGANDVGWFRQLLDVAPDVLKPLLVRSVGWVYYELPVDWEQFGLPADPFGSAMVSNIGSFGLERAYAPLVPVSRAPLVVLPGAINDAPVAEQGAAVVRPVLDVCCTADHRCYDGVHGSRFVRELREMLEEPAEHFIRPADAGGES
ncbi:MAG: 2-oxo acid dehydrogenase subunit E2 [Bradymonadaceae bacterium]